MDTDSIYKAEVSFAWLGDADELFKPTTGNVIIGVKGNPLFPASQALVLAVEVDYLVYAPTVVGRNKVNSETAAARAVARAPVEAKLRDLLYSVQLESNGSLPALLTTNIPLVRKATPTQAPGTPGGYGFFLFGNPEVLYVKCEAQENAQVYFAEVSREPDVWLWHASDVKSAVGFTNLPSGETLHVRMRVKNAVSMGPWGPIVSFMIPPEGVAIPVRARPRGVR